MSKFLAAVAAILVAAPAALACDTCGCTKETAVCTSKCPHAAQQEEVAASPQVPMLTVSHHEEGSAKKGSGAKTPDIVDIAASLEDFSTLVAAVKAAGLVDALKGDGPFTVFAPTNEAFERLPDETIAALLTPEGKQQLTNILLYHVVPGKVLAKDVVGVKSADTLLKGKSVSVKVKDGKRVYIDGARVIKTDVLGSNGVIHVIDTVILPKE